MKKKLEEKIKQYAEVRRFAETTQRKQLIDSQARSYIFRHSNSVEDYTEAMVLYRENYNR